MNIIESQEIEKVKENFSKRMSDKIEALGVSKKELANHLNVSVNTIRNILKGENFNFKVAIMVDKALDLNFFISDQDTTNATIPEPIPTLVN